jgi:hypothetical protein
MPREGEVGRAATAPHLDHSFRTDTHLTLPR